MWIPESGKFLLKESGKREIFACWSRIQGFVICNSPQGIRSPITIGIQTTFHWQKIRNPLPGVLNPLPRIHNPRLSRIFLHGAILLSSQKYEFSLMIQNILALQDFFVCRMWWAPHLSALNFYTCFVKGLPWSHLYFLPTFRRNYDVIFAIFVAF